MRHKRHRPRTEQERQEDENLFVIMVIAFLVAAPVIIFLFFGSPV